MSQLWWCFFVFVVFVEQIISFYAKANIHCQIEMLAYDWHWRFCRILSAEYVLAQNQIKCHRKYEWKISRCVI